MPKVPSASILPKPCPKCGAYELNASQAADFFGCDRQTISRWLQENPPLPGRQVQGARGMEWRIPTAAAFYWYAARALQQHHRGIR